MSIGARFPIEILLAYGIGHNIGLRGFQLLNGVGWGLLQYAEAAHAELRSTPYNQYLSVDAVLPLLTHP